MSLLIPANSSLFRHFGKFIFGGPGNNLVAAWSHVHTFDWHTQFMGLIHRFHTIVIYWCIRSCLLTSIKDLLQHLCRRWLVKVGRWKRVEYLWQSLFCFCPKKNCLNLFYIEPQHGGLSFDNVILWYLTSLNIKIK